MQQANKLFVVGIGYRPLDTRAREVLQAAEVILASRRLAEVFQQYGEYDQVKDRIKVINNVDETIAFIKAAHRTPNPELQTIILLASGDPQFFGIGRRAIAEFGRDAVEILPDLSSIQVAFARIKEPWDDALLMSLHGGPDPEKRRKLKYELRDIPSLLEKHGKIAVLTDRENNPAEIARILHSAILKPTAHISPLARGGLRGVDSALVMHVCEHLGYPDEKITKGTPEEIAGMFFSDPNVVILIKEGVRGQGPGVGTPSEGLFFGLREDEIQHERGLITKDEVRAVTLHKLRLPQEGVLWDVGAGSGSISIEAARLCPRLRVIALEKDQERIHTIRANMQRFDIQNIDIIHGTAPDALADMPAPDRVFIGGSSGKLGEIVKLVNRKMASGIIVINAVTLETLNDALPALENNGYSAEVSEISVSRSKVVAGKRQMAALNPVFIVKGEKAGR